ncbi:MAG: hypothetical protein JEZ06_10450 [Anaerolineaceae bacterium]|nr:hypothetical protein [Anaerolineaceae bacterium]
MGMEISGAYNLRPIDPSGQRTLELRVNQRVTAEVLNVSGDQVELAIQGTRVVGRVAPGNETTELLNRGAAHFIIRGVDEGVLQLQLVPPEEARAQIGIQTQWTILASNLLKLNGLPLNQENMMIGRALLSLGLPISPELISKLMESLSGLGNWGQAEADLAAVMLSNGLPLSSGTISLALQQLPSLAEAFQGLEEMLGKLMQSNPESNIQNLAQRSLSFLNSATIDWSASASELMKQLTESISIWGKSLESHLVDLIKIGGSSAEDPDNSMGLLTFAQLRRALAQSGNTNLVNEIDRFMDAIRQMQLSNTSQINDPTNPPWLLLDLPLKMGPGQEEQQSHDAANLRISYRADEEGKSIDPDNNRLVLNIDLSDGHVLEVDLSMVGKRVGAWMTVSSEGWKTLVEEELPSFEKGLETLGYTMQFANCEVKFKAKVMPEERIINKLDLEA